MSTVVLACGALMLVCGWTFADRACCDVQVREVVGSRVNLRSGPSTNSKSLALLSKGALVALLAKQPGWAKVQSDPGQQGWMACRYLSLPKFHHWKAVGRGWINANSVNIRAGPSTEDLIKGKTNKGTPVKILNKMGKWCYVRFNSPTEGWVADWLINLDGKTIAVQQNRGPALSSSKGDVPRGANPKASLPGKGILEAAKKYLGCPYRFGGSTPAGFDCSGFVFRVMADLGKRLPRSGREMLAVGAPVSRESLLPGDVLFFKNTYRRGISHVGIYMGDNKFIHASSPGGSVRITPLSNSYYAARYCGARRM